MLDISIDNRLYLLESLIVLYGEKAKSYSLFFVASLCAEHGLFSEICNQEDYMHRRLYFITFACLLMGVLLAACGSGSGSVSTSSNTANTPPSNSSSTSTTAANGPNATATAAETSLIQQMTLVGTPTAKIVSGTTFAVTGKIKNGDDKQHDIYIQASLLDASGKVIVSTAPYNVDNVPGGATVAFTVQGTTPQPTWSSVKVTVTKVSENINGSGDD